MESEIEKVMKKMKGKNVKVIISGIIESKFYINKLRYVIEDGILVIEDSDISYLDIDIDNIENLYLEFTSDGYALFVFEIKNNLYIELQVFS